MRVVSIVGARPQFIKAAPLVREIARAHESILVHTGQHYDANMSDVFFDELDLPAPDYHLGVGSGRHGAQTAAMLERIEPVLAATRPDRAVVFGDTNSTLAGALAASKLGVKLAHVEAGLRSFNRAMPEEINRLVVDRVADVLLCPSAVAVTNLAREGITRGVHVVGDLMSESLDAGILCARERSTVLARLGLRERGFLVLTIHRAENADDPASVARIVAALEESGEAVIFPVHPRVRPALTSILFGADSPVRPIEPLGYLDMLRLESAARLIVTDSGGVQKEAYWLGVPCVTLRRETEWTETVDAGWNRLVGKDVAKITAAVRDFEPPPSRPPLYGNGAVSSRIVAILEAGA